MALASMQRKTNVSKINYMMMFLSFKILFVYYYII